MHTPPLDWTDVRGTFLCTFTASSTVPLRAIPSAPQVAMSRTGRYSGHLLTVKSLIDIYDTIYVPQMDDSGREDTLPHFLIFSFAPYLRCGNIFCDLVFMASEMFQVFHTFLMILYPDISDFASSWTWPLNFDLDTSTVKQWKLRKNDCSWCHQSG